MENRWNGLFYHHSRPLEQINYGPVRQSRVTYDEIDEAFLKAYDWLGEHVGFFPLFLALGDTQDAILETGWQNQWRRKIDSYSLTRYGSKRNEVLFSYKDIANSAFVDSQYWTATIGNFANNYYEVSDYWRRLILKPSWKKSDWLREARRQGDRVEAIVPELDLRTADLISVRNQDTRRLLERQGFQNVEVARISVNHNPLPHQG